jgi:phage terminase large subunit-like protein
VIQVWDQPSVASGRFLLLRHQVRVRVGFEGLCEEIVAMHAQWRPERILIEGEKLGQAAVDLLKKDLPIDCLPTGGKDKVARAGRLIMKLERGEIFLPKYDSTWRPKLEAEMLAWTGDERQPADQIDAAAYAAIHVGDGLPGPIRIPFSAVRS